MQEGDHADEVDVVKCRVDLRACALSGKLASSGGG